MIELVATAAEVFFKEAHTTFRGVSDSVESVELQLVSQSFQIIGNSENVSGLRAKFIVNSVPGFVIIEVWHGR